MSAPEAPGEPGPASQLSSARRIAIVHEKFTVDAGAERCVEQLHALWPEAPVFTTVCDESTLSTALRSADIRPSPTLMRLYRGGDRYAHLLPALAPALAHHDLSTFDVVITSHHAFANRVRPRPDATVISYTHTPARWIWDPRMRKNEVGGAPGRAALGLFAATQRGADRRAAARVDTFAANSTAVAERVQHWWGRAATVVAPPVDVDAFTPDNGERDDFFLVAGRLVPYKRPDIAVAAAREAGVRLVVAGDGRFRARCEAVAGPRTEFVSSPSRATLVGLFRRCRALLHPGIEDFGIMTVEAQACGAPVIALDAGGARDTVVDGVTGLRYRVHPNDAAGNATGRRDSDRDEIATLASLLRAFRADDFDARAIRNHAERFAIPRFREQMLALVERSARTPQ